MAEKIAVPLNLTYRQTDIRTSISNYRVVSLLIITVFHANVFKISSQSYV